MQINRQSTHPEDYLDTFVTRFPHVQVRTVATPQVIPAHKYCGNTRHQQFSSPKYSATARANDSTSLTFTLDNSIVKKS